MREIKFRVWNKATSQWVHRPGWEVNLFGEMVLLGGFMRGISLLELNDCVICQYTGIKDKHGNEIYEGDILCIPETDPASSLGNSIVIVEYKYSGFGYIEVGVGRFESLHSIIGESEVDNSAEVIGNIFENPEFLK